MRNVRLQALSLWVVACGLCSADDPEPRRNDELVVPAAVPVPQEFEDLAIACTVLGRCAPAVDELPLEQYLSIVTVVGRVLQTYREPSFDAFLQLHRRDLVFASKTRAAEVPQLRTTIIDELNVPDADVPHEWVAVLRAYWDAFYTGPIIRRTFPEQSTLVVDHLDVAGMPKDAWLAAFNDPIEARRERSPKRVNHRMAIPHRRTLEEIAETEGRLQWFDLELQLELGRLETFVGWVFLRFVWDDVDRDWFLHRAITFYPDDWGDRNTSFLLF